MLTIQMGFILALMKISTICIWDCKEFDAPPTGYQSFVFQTKNLDSTVEWLKGKGLPLADPVRYDRGTNELRLKDIDGNEIVIAEFV